MKKYFYETDNFLKKALKMFIAKMMGWVINPIIFNQEKAEADFSKFKFELSNTNAEISRLSTELSSANAEISRLSTELSTVNAGISDIADDNNTLKEAINKEAKSIAEVSDKLAPLARECMRTKWKLIDNLESQIDNSKDIVRCGICGAEAEVEDLQTMETECIFAGGRLERYVCKECGVIFGPTKFDRLPQQESDDDYTVHYLGYSEGDSTYKEVRAFHMLLPDKECTYLNYGCGKWSASINQLREEGYKVYGYEPYADDADSPYIITEQSELRKYRFDGIFSNDLLEHLKHPAEDLLFMKSLLRSPASKMSHSTSCYIYKHEYTRFHLFFFTGESVNILCEKTNMKIVEFVNDEPENDFICCVFEPLDEAISFLPQMLCPGSKENEIPAAQKDEIIFGPYLNLANGNYKFKFDLELPDDESTIEIACTAEKGSIQLGNHIFKNGRNEIKINFDKEYNDVEFVIRNPFDEKIKLLYAAMM